MSWSLETFVPRRRRYFGLMLLLVKSGKPDLIELPKSEFGDIDDWDTDGLKVLIDEGRRRREDELATLNQIRSRAQLVLSTSLIVLAALASGASGFTLRWPTVDDIVVAVGFVSGAVAALGAAAVVVVGARIGVVDLARLTVDSTGHTDVLHALAGQYLDILHQNRRVVSTWHTCFFESVVWLLLAAGCAVLRIL